MAQRRLWGFLGKGKRFHYFQPTCPLNITMYNIYLQLSNTTSSPVQIKPPFICAFTLITKKENTDKSRSVFVINFVHVFVFKPINASLIYIMATIVIHLSR